MISLESFHKYLVHLMLKIFINQSYANMNSDHKWQRKAERSKLNNKENKRNNKNRYIGQKNYKSTSFLKFSLFILCKVYLTIIIRLALR
uniref:Uncharacterized protein n=1 Tax=Acidianus sulfidivorans JP7 TaxID=619593 RepID=A0A2U9IPE6_9CREN